VVGLMRSIKITVEVLFCSVGKPSGGYPVDVCIQTDFLIACQEAYFRSYGKGLNRPSNREFEIHDYLCIWRKGLQLWH